jgi:Protein of unknown function (DUF2735)
MTTNVSGSAKIYTFPRRGRFATGDQGEASQALAAAQLPRGLMTACGSSWYHEDAIREAAQTELTRKP